MQFPADIQSHTSSNNNPATAATNLFNLGFISNPTGDNNNTNSNSNSSNNNNNLQSSLLNQFSGGNNGSNEGGAANIFSVNIMGDHQISSGAVPSLYSNATGVGVGVAGGSGGGMPHMSATALLQKAAQLGSTTSSSNTTATLLRTFGSSSSSGGKPSDRTLFPPSYGGVFGENENNLQDLMNSFSSGGSASGIFGAGNGMNSFGGFDSGGNRTTNMETLEDPKLQQNLTAVSMGGTDRLTRDFLGVGQIVRSMSSGGGGGGGGHKQPPQGIVLDPSESNSAPSSQAFGGGNYQ